MTITNISDRELRLQAEVADLKAQLRDTKLNFETYCNGAVIVHQRLTGEIRELKSKLAALEKPEPVGWATVAQLKRGAFMEGATPPSYMEGLIPLYTKGTPNV